MRKITLKTTKYHEENGSVLYCIGDIIFADTKEKAGVRKGWSGNWTVTNNAGEEKHFTTEKGIREWLGKEAAAAPVMTEAEELKAYIAKHGNNWILPKK
jgi:hypothetical protein